MQEEIAFEKYRKRGAYHWRNYFGGLLKVDSFLRGRYDLVVSFLRKSGITATSKVLEVGCGDGALSGLIYKTFQCDLTGLEPSADGIRYCKEMCALHRFKGNFRISEGYTFDCANNTFESGCTAVSLTKFLEARLFAKPVQQPVEQFQATGAGPGEKIADYDCSEAF